MKPCDIKTSDCPCDGNPLSNFTSEAPDKDVFIAFNSGWGNHAPNPGDVYTNPDGYGYCQNVTSQEEADLCAANCQLNNQLDNGNPDCGSSGGGGGGAGGGTGGDANDGGNRGGGGGAALYFNSEQICTVTCPDGTPFTYTLPAHSISDNNPTMVDRIAQSIACQRANEFKICISDITSPICVDEEYDQTLTATTNTPGEITWLLVSGSLPPGIQVQFDPFDSTSISLQGTPTQAGNFTFVIQAADGKGNSINKTFKLGVIGFTNTPPAATTGSAYSFTLTADGGTAPYTFTIVDGNLPAGLTMSALGTISGTPTTQGSDTFKVQIEDDNNKGGCQKQFTISHFCTGANWQDMALAVFPQSVGACGCPGCVANQNSMTYARSMCSGAPEFCDIFYGSSQVTSTVPFTLRVTVNTTKLVSGFFQHTMPLYRNGVFNQDLELGLTYPLGSSTHDFVLPAGTYKIGNGGVQNARYAATFGGDGTGAITWTFLNKC